MRRKNKQTKENHKYKELNKVNFTFERIQKCYYFIGEREHTGSVILAIQRALVEDTLLNCYCQEACKDSLLTRNRHVLQWNKSWKLLKISIILKINDKFKILESYLQSTYMWTRLGNLESSGGICPLIELLFMWLFKKKKIKRNKKHQKKKKKDGKTARQTSSGFWTSSIRKPSQMLRFVQVCKWFRKWSRYVILVNLYSVQIWKITQLFRQGTC